MLVFASVAATGCTHSAGGRRLHKSRTCPVSPLHSCILRDSTHQKADVALYLSLPSLAHCTNYSGLAGLGPNGAGPEQGRVRQHLQPRGERPLLHLRRGQSLSIASLWRSLATASIYEIERLDDSPHQGTMPHYTLGTPIFTCLTPLPCLSSTESTAVL